MNNLAILQNYSQLPPGYENDKEQSMLELVAHYARVSNPASQAEGSDPERLINYLARNKHWSPFEMVSACIEINTTRDIGRQLLRHRSFSFQEFSQRYANVTENLDFQIRDARLQDKKNRQNSIHTDDEELKKAWVAKQQQLLHETKLAYAWAIDNGIAKEQARAVLPEGNTSSRLYVNGTVRSWIHYVELRTTPGTQLEHMEVARAAAKALEPAFPMIMEFVRS